MPGARYRELCPVDRGLIAMSGSLGGMSECGDRRDGLRISPVMRHRTFFLQLPNPRLQELPLRFLLGQRQSFLIRGPGFGCPAQPAARIRAG